MNITGRHSGLFDISKANFQILGCGGIGSYTAINLAKMGGVNFDLYDMDAVDLANVGVSAFGLDDIGHYKVGALKVMILNINSKAKINTHYEAWGPSHSASRSPYSSKGNDIVLLSFDNMSVRKRAVEIVTAFSGIKALIDSRMGAETFIMYTFPSGPTIEDYERFWHSDEEGDDEPCNARATSYCSSMAGAFAANAVRRIITGDQPISTKVMFHFPSMLLTAGN